MPREISSLNAELKKWTKYVWMRVDLQQIAFPFLGGGGGDFKCYFSNTNGPFADTADLNCFVCDELISCTLNPTPPPLPQHVYRLLLPIRTVLVRDGHGRGWSRKINAWHLHNNARCVNLRHDLVCITMPVA